MVKLDSYGFMFTISRLLFCTFGCSIFSRLLSALARIGNISTPATSLFAVASTQDSAFPIPDSRFVNHDFEILRLPLPLRLRGA